jgi:hypothetical protein
LPTSPGGVGHQFLPFFFVELISLCRLSGLWGSLKDWLIEGVLKA